MLGGYRFDAYREKSDETSRVAALTLLVAARPEPAREPRRRAPRRDHRRIAERRARALEPAAERALARAARAGGAHAWRARSACAVRVFDVPELERRKMGAILAVGGGSARPPRLIALEYAPKGAAKKARPRARASSARASRSTRAASRSSPPQGMDEMKHDMSGAATVIGVLRACALLELPIRVVGVIGAAENLPERHGLSARRHRHRGVGQDDRGAEHRRRGPRRARRRAALCEDRVRAGRDRRPRDADRRVRGRARALGDRPVRQPRGPRSRRSARAGEKTGELAWPMPLLDGHKREIKQRGRRHQEHRRPQRRRVDRGGVPVPHFVGDTPWVHLDIAGTAWTTTPACGYQPRGATGVGVRLLRRAAAPLGRLGACRRHAPAPNLPRPFTTPDGGSLDPMSRHSLLVFRPRPSRSRRAPRSPPATSRRARRRYKMICETCHGADRQGRRARRAGHPAAPAGLLEGRVQVRREQERQDRRGRRSEGA